jgi:mRNA interferase MazF
MKKTSGKKFHRRGEVYWVKLDPTVGLEINKKGPCLIVSNDLIKEVSNIVIVAPITSKLKKIYPCEVKDSFGKKHGKILLQQWKAIDKSRLEGKLDHLDFDVMSRVDEAIKVTFGLS